METVVRYKSMSLIARQKISIVLDRDRAASRGRADAGLRPKNEATLRAYSMQEHTSQPSEADESRTYRRCAGGKTLERQPRTRRNLNGNRQAESKPRHTITGASHATGSTNQANTYPAPMLVKTSATLAVTVCTIMAAGKT